MNFWEAKPGETPPTLQPFLGQRVRRAWLLPEGTCLFVLLEGGGTLMAEAAPMVGAGGDIALQIETGSRKEGSSFADLDGMVGRRDPHLDRLTGMRFTGLDGDVLLFDDEYGVRFRPGTVAWVKYPPGWRNLRGGAGLT